MHALADELNEILKLGLDAESEWLRSGISRGLGQEGAVDRDARVIRGFAVVTKGPAIGHNMEIDETFLDQVVLAGNQAKQGIKSRFDHPNASSTSMGTVLGRAKNFRRDADVVRADLYLLEAATRSPDGDLAGYTMDLAEEDPAAFGASIVFKADKLERKDEHGKPLPSIPRLTKLMAADVVDDPAANPTGMFARDSLAAKVTAFLDRYVEQSLQATLTSLIRQEVSAMSGSATVEQDGVQAAKEAGVKAERERVMGIRRVCQELKTPEIADDLIELGVSIEEATKTCKLRRLGALQLAAPVTAGGADGTVTTDLSALPEGDEKWKKEFAASQALQEEFMGKESTYLAFKRAEANGQIKIYKGDRVK